MTWHPVSIDDIQSAAGRIQEHVLRTPVLSFPQLNDELGVDLSFKCENMQHVGAFKARGACNAVFQLNDAEAAAGVVAHSSGNHAAALARAANLRGITAHIVMPHNSAKIKIDAVRSFGVEPVFCEPTTEARQQAANEVIDRTGANLVHPYDDVRVIAGQGTTALEILEQTEDVDTLLIPVGGGGLLSGSLIAAKSLRPDIRVVAVEPAWADDTYRSWKSGKIEQPTRYDSIGDGLRTRIGEITFPIILDLVDDVVTVSEENILLATRRMFRQCKLVVEPSGAVPLGAVLEYPNQFDGRKIVAVVTGGNMDFGSIEL